MQLEVQNFILESFGKSKRDVDKAFNYAVKYGFINPEELNVVVKVTESGKYILPNINLYCQGILNDYQLGKKTYAANQILDVYRKNHDITTVKGGDAYKRFKEKYTKKSFVEKMDVVRSVFKAAGKYNAVFILDKYQDERTYVYMADRKYIIIDLDNGQYLVYNNYKDYDEYLTKALIEKKEIDEDDGMAKLEETQFARIPYADLNSFDKNYLEACRIFDLPQLDITLPESDNVIEYAKYSRPYGFYTGIYGAYAGSMIDAEKNRSHWIEGPHGSPKKRYERRLSGTTREEYEELVHYCVALKSLLDEHPEMIEMYYKSKVCSCPSCGADIFEYADYCPYCWADIYNPYKDMNIDLIGYKDQQDDEYKFYEEDYDAWMTETEYLERVNAEQAEIAEEFYED